MPSKSRGLRTSTGCLTCRKRRVKCDEALPRCQNCTRLEKPCSYPQTGHGKRPSPRTLNARKDVNTSLTTIEPESTTLPVEGNNPSHAQISDPWGALPIDASQNLSSAPDLSSNGILLDETLFPLGEISLNLDLGPLEWYDLLAEDAIMSINEHNASSSHYRWNFDKFSLSRRQTPRESPAPNSGEVPVPRDNSDVDLPQEPITEPWNTTTRIQLGSEELVFFEHYVVAVGPILDLFDPERHFTSVVPHLALHNEGLLKSILAVGAYHMALDQNEEQGSDQFASAPPRTPASTRTNPIVKADASRIAEQYYYETLHWLSQNLLYPSYTSSHEILATAIMISTYEMFGAFGTDNGNWARHLKGAFWIQRNQDNDGESADGLRRAVWWAWLRQDLWAAFREGRPAMTIWQPKIRLAELSAAQLATRIIYIAAKCVQFAASPKEVDVAGYIEAGERLLLTLQQWRSILPPSFEPIFVASSHLSPTPSGTDTASFPPIWIHPPSHAAAIQTFHFARIVVLLNQPSLGGLNKYQTRGRMLRESMSTVCGIACAQQSQNLPSAFVNFQAVYAAALCAEDEEKQIEALAILERTLYVSRFPAKALLDDILKLWHGTT